MVTTTRYIVIFDGVCNFCNGAVNFIIQRDHADKFVFTPLQSPVATGLIAKHGIEEIGQDSFVLIKHEQCYFRTDAALEISKDLSGYWYVFRIFKLLPRPVRDYFYRLLARNRYRLFGKTEHCMVPTPELKQKFLWNEM